MPGKVGQVAGSMQRKVATLISGGPLDGPVRHVYSAARSHIPARFLSEEAVKSHSYDTMTLEIARKVLSTGGCAIDVGAHDGSILRHLVKFSPGPHWAFEPVPSFAERLRKRFPDVKVEQFALSDSNGEATFNFLPGAAAYSSLLRREQIESGQVVRRLTVRVRTLDDYLPADANIAFLKIDVEGAEPAVLRGARRLLSRSRPVTVFECDPSKLRDCIEALSGTGMRVSFLADYLAGVIRSEIQVVGLSREQGEYYYVAHG